MCDKFYINGIGLVHPAGSLESLLEAFSGKSREGERGAPVPLSALLPGANLRRVPGAARAALQAAALALQDAGMHIPLDDAVGVRTGIFTGSAHGAVEGNFDFMNSLIDFGARLASPTAFSHSVHNVFTGMLSLYLKAQGPGYTSGQFGISFAGALQAAGVSLLCGDCDFALLTAVEETSDFLKYIYGMNWFSPDGGNGSPEYPELVCAVCFVLGRHQGAQGVEISLPVWDEAEAASKARDLLFSSARYKKREENSAICTVDCRALYGSTPAAQALDTALGALALRSGALPASAWRTRGEPAGMARSVACEMFDAATSSYSAIFLKR